MQQLDCNLDLVLNDSETRVVFEVNATSAGQQTITATIAGDRDSDTSDNAASTAIDVVAPAAPPAAVAPTKRVAPRTFSGTARNDRLVGTPSGDLLYGRAGNDLLLGGGGNDVLYGGTGNDTLDGGKAADRLYAGPGNDVLRARDGVRDVVDCGPGRDLAFVDRLDRVSGCETVKRA
jgi:hypothetical protein